MFAKLFLSILLLSFFGPLCAEVKYEVQFGGVEKEVIPLLKSASQLSILQDRPPATTAALRRRADADTPNILQVLHSLALYEAKVEIEIDSSQSPVQVLVKIEPGLIYPIGSFVMLSSDEGPLPSVKLKNLGVALQKPALPKTILDAENKLLQHLAKKGYPLAKIMKRDVKVDVLKKEVDVTLLIEKGPQAKFGRVSIRGAEKVQEQFIHNKIQWDEEACFDPSLLEQTQETLETCGLFSSVIITIGEELDEENRIPVFIEVQERKHRTMGFGASYNTQLGLGITMDWEHRNIRGLGNKLSLRTDLWQKLQRGMVLYRQPDIFMPSQDLLLALEAEHEVTKGFREISATASALLERQVTERTRISYGLAFKELYSEKSNNNGPFSLVKTPFLVRWSSANNLLDPTRGQTLYFKSVPTLELNHFDFYSIHNLITTYYLSLDKEGRYVLASKINLGSILGSKNREIPPPERFYAGSENTLRGYQYLTVSPLKIEKDDHKIKKKPIGGRSLMIYSLELRMRTGEKYGWVLFYEIGNVYKQTLPQFIHKQLQSVGLGFRYHTAVGPLRADFAVPLNRRKGLDKKFQFYLSIGQAF